MSTHNNDYGIFTCLYISTEEQERVSERKSERKREREMERELAYLPPTLGGIRECKVSH